MDEAIRPNPISANTVVNLAHAAPSLNAVMAATTRRQASSSPHGNPQRVWQVVARNAPHNQTLRLEVVIASLSLGLIGKAREDEVGEDGSDGTPILASSSDNHTLRRAFSA